MVDFKGNTNEETTMKKMNIVGHYAPPKKGYRSLDRIKYEAFCIEWKKTHTISAPPSFNSYKTFYR